MNKYIQIFKISFQQEFAYKTSFVMWRVRNLLQIVIAFFLWDTIFTDPQMSIFGYDKIKMLTYVFLLMIVRAVVLSARAVDVSSDISEGNLSNHLLRPISYFRYWITRDVSSKVLNLTFSFLEFGFLFLVFRPNFYFPNNSYVIMAFIVSLALAASIYFCVLFLVSAIPFWAPELGWGSQFLVIIVIIEFLSGTLFPIDVLPAGLQKIVMTLPFPYMVFFPIQVYLGKISGAAQVWGFVTSGIWLVALGFLMKVVWSKGLKKYQALGR